MSRQSTLLDISRSSLYYQPTASEEDLVVMNLIDELYTDCPFYGSRKMKHALDREHGVHIGREHTQRLMRIMGIEAIYPKRKGKDTSQGNPSHKKYPYLLKGLTINYPNHVWGSDITYIRLTHGWAYLVAILDWYSRYVVAWRLSSTLELPFCIEMLTHALALATPTIFNSDQGSHYTSHEMTGMLADSGVAISMDGRGRCMDNIFTERLWRTVKYENVYVKSYATYDDAHVGIADYLNFYNTKRGHQALAYRTPAEVYFQERNDKIVQPLFNHFSL